MSLPTIFDLCQPRDDVVRGAIQEADFAADLAQVLRGEAPDETKIPAQFFANTHPTQGLKNLLHNVCLRLAGRGGEVSSLFRLHTQYGGGKTHALIALTHAANGMQGVGNIDEFVDPAIVPRGRVRVAAFDGENADPASGRPMGAGVRALTPWGELAFQLAGGAGYETLRANDEKGVAPGAENIRALFGGEPTLILLDELAVFLRKAKTLPVAEQLVPFLTSLFKAVEGTPNAAVVYTLAIGKGGKAEDAYGAEHQFIADKMAEAESVSARKATLLDPTTEEETAQVVRRRLFKAIDDDRAAAVIAAYQQLWATHRDVLPPERAGEDRIERFRRGYPLHPEMMAAFTDKLSTLSNFQRVRGMLRILARGVRHLWEQRPAHAYAVHLHHLDPGFGPIKQELVTRLNLPLFDAPIRNDVSGEDGGKAALAEEFDQKIYAGMPPYGSIVARPILFHSLAFNESLKGLNERELLYSVLAPGIDPSFVDDARKRFIAESAYLDDRPNVPLRFLTEANLTQVIRRQENLIDAGEARNVLNDTIKVIFKDATLDLIPFASEPGDVPDDSGEGKPYLVLIGYDADSVRAGEMAIPPLVERIFRYKGASGTDFRRHLNNLVFIVADEARKEELRRRVIYRLALDQLRKPERLAELAEHQRDRVKELYRRSEQEVAVAIQQCYRHVFYPSRNRLEGASVDLNHSAIDVQSASEAPGSGQKAVVRLLRDLNKLRMEDDSPDSPAYIRDRTPLKKGQISTAELRAEFRRDAALPMLIGDGIFVKAIRQGIELGEYVYRSGDLLYGRGDPPAQIRIDEQSFVFTVAYATEKGIWPRPAPPPPASPPASSPVPPSAPPAGGSTTPVSGVREGPAPPPVATELVAEGVLREALTRLWEMARSRRINALGQLSLRLFDPTDAFRLMGAVNAVQGATKTVHLDAGYETSDNGEANVIFTGPINDALPIKDFLDPQFRAAKDRSFNIEFKLVFADGLALGGDAPETLTERLARYSSGAAYVTATAKSQS
jgi:hypothetical protein